MMRLPNFSLGFITIATVFGCSPSDREQPSTSRTTTQVSLKPVIQGEDGFFRACSQVSNPNVVPGEAEEQVKRTLLILERIALKSELEGSSAELPATRTLRKEISAGRRFNENYCRALDVSISKKTVSLSGTDREASSLTKEISLPLLFLAPIDTLDISFNNLSSEDLEKVQFINPNLRIINLSHNNLKNLRVLDALPKQHKGLENLNVSHNDLRASEIQSSLWEQGRSFGVLDISSNPEFSRKYVCKEGLSDGMPTLLSDEDPLLKIGWEYIDVSYTAISCLSFVFSNNLAADRLLVLKIDGLTLDSATKGGTRMNLLKDKNFSLSNLFYLSARDMKLAQSTDFPIHIFAANAPRAPQDNTTACATASMLEQPAFNCAPNLVTIDLTGTLSVTQIGDMAKVPASGPLAERVVLAPGGDGNDGVVFSNIDSLMDAQYCAVREGGKCMERYGVCHGELGVVRVDELPSQVVGIQRYSGAKEPHRPRVSPEERIHDQEPVAEVYCKSSILMKFGNEEVPIQPDENGAVRMLFQTRDLLF